MLIVLWVKRDIIIYMKENHIIGRRRFLRLAAGGVASVLLGSLPRERGKLIMAPDTSLSPENAKRLKEATLMLYTKEVNVWSVNNATAVHIGDGIFLTAKHTVYDLSKQTEAKEPILGLDFMVGHPDYLFRRVKPEVLVPGLDVAVLKYADPFGYNFSTEGYDVKKIEQTGGFTAIPIASRLANEGDLVSLATYQYDTLHSHEGINFALNYVRGRVIDVTPNRISLAMGIDLEALSPDLFSGASGSAVANVRGELTAILFRGSHFNPFADEPANQAYESKVLQQLGYDQTIIYNNPLFGIYEAIPLSAFARYIS